MGCDQWSGKGEQDRRRPGSVVVRVDSRYYRPAEVESLLEMLSKKLDWFPTSTLEELVREMVEADMQNARKEAMSKKGFEVIQSRETL